MKQTLSAIGSAIGIFIQTFALLAVVDFAFFMLTYSESGGGGWKEVVLSLAMIPTLLLPVWAAIASYRKVKQPESQVDHPAP